MMSHLSVREGKKKAERKWVISLVKLLEKKELLRKFKVFKFGQLKMLLLEV